MYRRSTYTPTALWTSQWIDGIFVFCPDMKKDLIINGVGIGEHSFNVSGIISEITERVIKPGYNYVTLAPRRAHMPAEDIIKWAEFLADNQIYFRFSGIFRDAHDIDDGKISPEIIQRIKEIAGEYFLGDSLAEMGSSLGAKMPGYYTCGDSNYETKGRSEPELRFDFDNVKQAHDYFIETVSHVTELDRRAGVPNTMSVEATALVKYVVESGVNLPIAELMCGSPDVILSAIRGTVKAFGLERWGTHIAHEWYGGLRHSDTLKRKRLSLGYKYSYMAGSSIFELESGDALLSSYGEIHERDSELCRDYRLALDEINEIIKSDSRPIGGPKVKLAFVYGLHDAWCGWGASSLWNQFFRKEWGHGPAEYSWRILDELGSKRSWSDVANYGDEDTSALPAHGMYDIIPIEADTDTLSKYDYLIFLGWNTMTEENADKLTEYVRRGGHLLMSAAHLNMSEKRDGELKLLPTEKLEALFGCRFLGEIRSTNDGVKFRSDGEGTDILYPATKSLICDPLYSAGYVRYARFMLTGANARELAFVSDSFLDRISNLPAVIENRIVKGSATLVCAIDYPGHPACYPLYRAMVRETVSASAREAAIRVIGSDRLRYAVYEGDKIYLLNTDYDLPINVRLKKAGKELDITLDPLEMRALIF